MHGSRVIAALSGLILLLAGCEAQEPVPGTVPQPQPAPQPVVNVGVGVGTSGTHAYGGVGFFQGPFSVYLGF
jgi:hypothetical protein